MKLLELFSLSRGKPLQEFDWGLSFIDLINQNLPIASRVTNPATTGELLYMQLLQLPSDKMFGILQLEVEVQGDKVGVSRPSGAGGHQMEHRSVYSGNFADPDPNASATKKSKTPLVALICACTLVVVCLGMAFTQSIMSVKSGRNVGDGRSVATIASIIGDVAKAFIDSGSKVNQPPRQQRPYNDPYQQQPYSHPRRPQQPVYPDEQPYEPYDPGSDPGTVQEPMRPHSGVDGEVPPYD